MFAKAKTIKGTGIRVAGINIPAEGVEIDEKKLRPEKVEAISSHPKIEVSRKGAKAQSEDEDEGEGEDKNTSSKKKK